MNQMPNPNADVLLVTVTDAETDAVRDLLVERFGRSFQQTFIDGKAYRDLGVIGGARTFLVRSEMGASGLGGALLTVDRGISTLRPASIIMLGIAFGLDPERQRVGDILVSRQLMAYDLQRIGTDSAGAYAIRARGDRPPASPRLLDLFRAGRDDWHGAPLHFGLILSGDKLVDNQDFRAQLLRLEPEAIGGDMEGAGLYVAAHDRKADWILVKAISDWADGAKSQSKSENQRLATHNAAAYVFHVLGQGGLGRPQFHPISQPQPSSQLRVILAERIDNEELRTICADIGLDPDDLAAQGKSARVRELIAYLMRRNELGRLYDWVQQNRPDIELPQ